METKELTRIEKTTQKLQLIKGEFSPSEASDIIIALIDEKINFHKIQRLQFWEGNHNYETDQLDGRIKELEEEKRIAREFLNKIRATGGRLKINGSIEITLVD
jgi:hypothetical protein